MSIIGMYTHIGPRVLEVMVRDPDLTQSVLDYDGAVSTGEDISLPPEIRSVIAQLPEHLREEMLAQMKASLASEGMGEFFGEVAKKSADALERAGVDPKEIGEALSIEKAWHGLHFVLAGTKWEATAPPGNVVAGGCEIGEDLGYGPARYLTVDEVRDASTALAAIDDEEFRKRYNREALAEAEVYPGGWDDPSELDWLLDAVRDVRAYFKKAADLGHAMMIYMT